MSTTVHLVDGSPYIFRAYFSMPDLRTPADEPAGAVHGFASFLVRYLREEEPTHLGIAFDESLNTSFRNELYPEYKAQRELPPAELEAQLGWCQELARGFGATVWVDDRYEADDLVATAVARVESEGAGCVVVSSDKDLGQLVSDRTELYDFAKGERMRAAEIRAKFGVEPAQIPDYLGLAGDAVDNIPGVKGLRSR